MKRKIITVLLLILTLSTFLRTYKLGVVPNGLSADEADMGYNAYSILKTGKDVYGRNYPLFFQSLDDYKPGFAIYSAVPAIKFFGLSDFSIRLVPALLGAISPLLLYFLLRLIFPANNLIAVPGAILMALAPWHIAISRATLMYVELVFFYLLFLVFFFLSLTKKPFFLILSAATLAATLYVYYAAIIYLPFIVILLFLIFRKDLVKNTQLLLLSAVTLLVISAPALVHYAAAQSKSRLSAISAIAPDVALPHSISQFEYDRQNQYPFSQIFHNRRLVYINAMLDNYFDYFNLDYLFVSAKETRYFYTNYVGLFYLIELPLFLLGLLTFLKKFQKIHKLLLGLLLIGPTSAMITLGSPFPHRAILTLFAIQAIVIIGLSQVRQKAVLLAVFIIFAFSAIFYLHQYFVHTPREFTTETDNGAWFSTVRDVMPHLNENKSKYEKIVFSWSYTKLVPGIYYLFYNQIDPAVIQSKAARWADEPPSFRQLYNEVENVQFRKIDWEKDRLAKNTLLIGYEDEFPQDVKTIINRTYYTSGKTHLIFVDPESL